MAARGALSLAASVWLLAAGGASAHRLAPSLLELREVAAGRVEVTWKQALLQPRGARLRPVLPAHCEEIGRADATRDAASATLRYRVDCGARGLVGAAVGVAGLDASRTDALLRVELADGRRVQAVLRAGEASLRIPERQLPRDVARQYLGLGFAHILGGLDHLAFVLGLVLLVAGRRALLLAVTAFTLGHSLTLSLAVLGFVGVPPALAELAIAATLLALAVELVPGASAASPLRRRPWAFAGLFGLVHGLGFAGALSEIGLPQEEIPLALLSFNVGIELGQLAFVAAVIAARRALAGVWRRAPRQVAPVPAYALGSLAALWCFERVAALL